MKWLDELEKLNIRYEKNREEYNELLESHKTDNWKLEIYPEFYEFINSDTEFVEDLKNKVDRFNVLAEKRRQEWEEKLDRLCEESADIHDKASDILVEVFGKNYVERLTIILFEEDEFPFNSIERIVVRCEWDKVKKKLIELYEERKGLEWLDELESLYEEYNQCYMNWIFHKGDINIDKEGDIYRSKCKKLLDNVFGEDFKFKFPATVLTTDFSKGWKDKEKKYKIIRLVPIYPWSYIERMLIESYRELLGKMS